MMLKYKRKNYKCNFNDCQKKQGVNIKKKLKKLFKGSDDFNSPDNKNIVD